MTRLGAAVLAVATLMAGCAAAPTPSGNLPGASPPAPDTSAPGRLVRIEDVSIDEARTVVALSFTGAPDYEPTNPCAMEYSAAAEVGGDVLFVSIFERRSPAALPLLPPMACPAVGFSRHLDVDLGEPFLGSTVRDRSGYTFFVAPPEGLVEIAIPDGWTLLLEDDLPESETGRWRRAWSVGNHLPGGGGPGRLDLIQSFSSPAYVEGTNEQPPVKVNDVNARLWTWEATGELVLVWQLERDGLALVANEADFSVEELVELAESAHLPD